MTTLAAIHRANASYALHNGLCSVETAVAMYLRSFEIFSESGEVNTERIASCLCSGVGLERESDGVCRSEKLATLSIFNAKDGGLKAPVAGGHTKEKLSTPHVQPATGFDWFYWLVLGAAITPWLMAWAWLELAVK